MVFQGEGATIPMSKGEASASIGTDESRSTSLNPPRSRSALNVQKSKVIVTTYDLRNGLHEPPLNLPIYFISGFSIYQDLDPRTGWLTEEQSVASCISSLHTKCRKIVAVNQDQGLFQYSIHIQIRKSGPRQSISVQTSTMIFFPGRVVT